MIWYVLRHVLCRLDYVWYLPVWSLEELLTCHKLVCPNLQVDVRQRYNDFGGSARFVIGEKAHIPFELVAESLSPEQAKAVYYLSMEGTESDLRHVFAHIAVSMGSMGGQRPNRQLT